MKIKQIISFIFGFLLLFLIYSYFGLKEAIIAFKKFTFLPLIIFLLSALIIEFLVTLRWHLILSANKIKLNFFKIWQYRLSGFAVGYLSPQPNIGGEPIKALLLKKDKINFKKGFSTVIIDRSIQTLTDLIFAFIMVIFIFFTIKIPLKTKIILFLAIAMPLLLMLYYFNAMKKNKPFFSKIFRKFKRLEKSLIEIEKIISSFHRKNNNIFVKTIIINIITYIILMIQYSSALMLFGISPNIFAIFVLLVSIILASAVPLPMNIGALEISQITALSFLKMDKSLGLSISLLIRAIDLIKTFIGLNSLFYLGINFEKIASYIKIKNGKSKKN